MKCCAECSYKHDPVLLCQMPIPVSDSNEATQDLYGNGCSAGWWCCVRYCSPPLDQQQELEDFCGMGPESPVPYAKRPLRPDRL